MFASKFIDNIYRQYLNERLEEIAGLLTAISKILLLDFKNKRTIKRQLERIDQYLVEDMEIYDEVINFKANALIFNDIFEHFKGAANAYLLISKRYDQLPLKINEFFQLTEFLMRCRFAISNFEQQYKVQENTFEEKTSFKKLLEKRQRRIDEKAKEKEATKQTLKSWGKPVSKKEPPIQKQIEKEDLNTFIKKALKKIHPKSKYFRLPHLQKIKRYIYIYI